MAWPIGGRRFWGGGGLQPRVLLQYALLTALGFFAMTMLFKDRSSLDLPNVSPSREDATPIGAELFNPPETKEGEESEKITSLFEN